ncbi:hypothetical protein FRB97_002842 [Tulasnella sp. 331]|nr:hypothetical protein FRB97_002842 [Tulasnella sp. 331]
MWAANYTTTVAWGNFSSVAFDNSSTVFVNGTQIYNWTATAAVIPTTAFHSDIPTGVSNGSALSTATATSINSTTAQQLSNSPTNGASRVTFGGLNVATIAGVGALISLL